MCSLLYVNYTSVKLAKKILPYRKPRSCHMSTKCCALGQSGFLCGFHVSFLEWLAGAHSGLLGAVPRGGSGALVHPWGAAGTTESRVPGGSAGRGPLP